MGKEHLWQYGISIREKKTRKNEPSTTTATTATIPKKHMKWNVNMNKHENINIDIAIWLLLHTQRRTQRHIHTHCAEFYSSGFELYSRVFVWQTVVCMCAMDVRVSTQVHSFFSLSLSLSGEF